MVKVFESGFWKVTVDKEENLFQVEYRDLLLRYPFQMALDEVREMSVGEIVSFIQSTAFDFPPEDEEDAWTSLEDLLQRMKEEGEI